MTIEQLISHAIALHQAGDIDRAEAMYRQVLAEDREHPVALHFLGFVAFQKGRVQVAADLMQRSVARNPNDPLPWRNLATVLKAAGKLEEALAAADRACALAPDFYEAHVARAELLSELGRNELALSAFAALHDRYGDDLPVLRGYAGALVAAGKTAEALEAYEKLAQLEPTKAEWPAAVAAICSATHRLPEAVAHYEKAANLSPGQGEYWEAIADLELRRHHLTGAKAALRALTALRPQDGRALGRLARVLEAAGDFGGALTAYTQALQAMPEDPELHTHLGEFFLRAGEFPRGWEELSWRYRHAARGRGPREAPLWDGNVLFAKRIFLHSPPAPAELLAAARFIPLVKDLGGHVIVECPRAFERLFAGLRGVEELVLDGDVPASVDVQCPLRILPGVMRTTLEHISPPGDGFKIAPEILERWIQHLPDEVPPDEDTPPRLRIGIVWRADPMAGNFDFYAREILASLMKTQRTLFYSLQRGDAGGMVAPPAGLDLIDLTMDIPDYAELAGLIARLSLVIGLDAPPVHLAAALGVPTWVLLPTHAHWLWMTRRTDSPWYPKVRLFRQ